MGFVHVPVGVMGDPRQGRQRSASSRPCGGRGIGHPCSPGPQGQSCPETRDLALLATGTHLCPTAPPLSPQHRAQLGRGDSLPCNTSGLTPTQGLFSLPHLGFCFGSCPPPPKPPAFPPASVHVCLSTAAALPSGFPDRLFSPECPPLISTLQTPLPHMLRPSSLSQEAPDTLGTSQALSSSECLMP